MSDPTTLVIHTLSCARGEYSDPEEALRMRCETAARDRDFDFVQTWGGTTHVVEYGDTVSFGDALDRASKLASPYKPWVHVAAVPFEDSDGTSGWAFARHVPIGSTPGSWTGE